VADLLSASSLILAVLAALLSLWTPELDRAITATIPPQKANAVLPLKPVKAALWGKALPLLLAVVACIAVFTPPTWDILRDAMRHHGDRSYRYDALKAAFVLTQMFLLAIATFLVIRSIGIGGKVFKHRS